MIGVRCAVGESNFDAVPEWLALIRVINVLCATAQEELLFDLPAHVDPWWAGGAVEEYAEARVVLPDADHGRAMEDGALIGKSDRADPLIRAAADQLLLTVVAPPQSVADPA